MKILYLFRHGETDWNAQERFQGHINIPLNDRGRLQAQELIPNLREAQIEAILSSDLDRAHETARIVANGIGVPVFQDTRLRETYLGLAQGMTKSEIEKNFGSEIVKQWKSNRITDADINYPEGETGTQVYERSTQAIRVFLATNSFQRIGIATHGGVIRRIMQRILPPHSPPVPIPNGVIYELRYDSQKELFFLPIVNNGTD